jgi:hypothetical protein
MSEALNSLCAIEYTGSDSLSEIQSRSAAALIERCAGTLTEVRRFLLWPEHQPALAQCMRLEVLTRASGNSDQHVLWLGLSQLHTLCDVSMREISFAALAAALPRLHTLDACYFRMDESAAPGPVDGFEDLLPRLRVFRFRGLWPEDECDAAAAPPRLPLLQELVWSPSCHRVAPHAFLGAQPTVLHAPYQLIARFCNADGSAPIQSAGPG